MGLEKIGEMLGGALAEREKGATLADATVDKLEKIIAGLRAVPVDVEIKVLPVQEGESEKKPAKKTPAKKAASKKAPTSKKAVAKKKAAARKLPVDVKSNVKQGD